MSRIGACRGSFIFEEVGYDVEDMGACIYGVSEQFMYITS
jgi:hypothetical protein